MLNGVGAAMIRPKAIGMFMGMKELMRMGHGMKCPVSGWIAVLMTVYAYRRVLISLLEVTIFLSPALFLVSVPMVVVTVFS